MLSDDDLKGSEGRLWRLIEQRTEPGADVARIDARIWDLFGETWAVMFTDLAGFSRQVAAFGIIHFLQTIFEQKRRLLPAICDHDGVLIKIEADSLIVLFKRVGSAVDAAISMQRMCRDYNATRPPEHHLLLCVGIGYGRILRIGDIDVYGQEVNAASKLGEDIARSWEILVTDAARVAAADVAHVSFEELGQEVAGSEKNWRLVYSV